MSTKSTKIQRIIVDNTNNRYIIITDKVAENPPKQGQNGSAFSFTQAQLENLATQAGYTTKQLIRNCKGAKLTFDMKAVKAGETYVVRTTGEEKTYTKDHVRFNNYTIELDQAKALNLDIADAMAEKLGNFNSFLETAGITVVENNHAPIPEDEEEEAGVIEEQQA